MSEIPLKEITLASGKTLVLYKYLHNPPNQNIIVRCAFKELDPTVILDLRLDTTHLLSLQIANPSLNPAQIIRRKLEAYWDEYAYAQQITAELAK